MTAVPLGLMIVVWILTARGYYKLAPALFFVAIAGLIWAAVRLTTGTRACVVETIAESESHGLLGGQSMQSEIPQQMV